MNEQMKLFRTLMSLRPGMRAGRNGISDRSRPRTAPSVRLVLPPVRGGAHHKPSAALPARSMSRGPRMAAATLLLLAAALALTLPGGADPSHAQDNYAGATERVLLSTLGEETAASSTDLTTLDAEIRFRPANHEPGYIITRVDIKFTGPANSASDLPFVALRNHVGTEMPLTGSATDLGGNTYAFTPAAPARIRGNIRYNLLIEGGTLSVAQTASDDVETGMAHLWNDLDVGYYRSHDSTGDTSSLSNGNSYMYSIRGRVVQPGATYVSNTGLTSTDDETLRSDDRAQPFTTGSDAAGYPLRSVYAKVDDNAITEFEGQLAHALPNLAIHRGSAAGPKVVDLPKPSSIWAPDYILETPVTLQPSTTYWVVAEAGRGDWDKVGTGEDSDAASGWSIGDKHEFRTAGNTQAFTQIPGTGALMIKIDGPATNSPAAGTPAITAPVLRVPATLSVDLSGITDADGAADIAHTATYRWQRFASDGITLRRKNIGTNATYTLTDGDVGKTIRVTVSLEDDNGFSEGPLTSDATSAVWQCPEPDLQGGATLIEGPRRIGIENYTVSGTEYHGYRDILFREHGTLDDDTFRTTATPTGYTIEAIEKTITAIWLNLDKALAVADKQSLALHVCEDHYALSDFTLGVGTLHGYFIRSEQDWSSLPEITFHISEDLVAPSFAEAWGDGTSLVIAFSEKLRPAASLSHNDFSVTKGANDDTVTLASGTPTVSGNTVELTLSSDIVATDTNIRVSYNKPGSGSGNRVADLVGNEAASFSSRPVVNLPADSVAPTLAQGNPATLASDGKTLTLTMNEAMKTDALPTSTAFTVEATPPGGSEAEVHLDATTPVEVSDSVVTLNLGTPIAHNDANVKVSYTVPGSGGKLQDRAGNDMASFTDQAVNNNSAIPRVGIEALHDDATPVIANPRFRFTASAAPRADLDLNLEMTQTGEHFSLDSVTIDANSATVEHETVGFVSTINEINTDGTATITVVGGDDHLPMPAPRNSATVEAKLPPTGPSAWVSHRQLAYSATEGEPFSIGIVFNAGEGVAQPRESLNVALLTLDSGTATINQDYIHLSEVAAAAPEDWTATGAGGYTYTHVQPIEIIDDDLYEPDTETFMVYMQSSQGVFDKLVIPHQNDPDGTATITITSHNPLGILEIEPASTAVGGYYGDGDTVRIKVTFNGNVTVDAAGGTPQFEFELGGETRQATYASRPGISDLIFNYTVTTADRDDHDGISWRANSLDPNGGTIHFTHLDVNRQAIARLTHVAQAPLPNHKVDTREPQLENAEVDGASLTLNYSEDLKTTAPPHSAFTVSVDGGAGVNPTNVVIAGSTVTLTLTSAVGQTQTATVSYTHPGQNANPLQDLSGKEAGPFSGVTVDDASDIVSFRATPGDRQVTLTWDRLVDSDLTRYQYRYMSTSDTGWDPDWTDIPGSNASTTSFTTRNLTNGIRYTFQVRPVYTRGGQTENGKAARVKSTPQAPLVAPTTFTATPGGTGEITLSWDDPNDVTITGYQYRYQTPSDTGWNPDWTDIPGSDDTTTSHTLSGLTWQVVHTFQLRAVRGSTAGPASAQAQATPPGDRTRPSEVRELRAVVHSNSRVQLYFRAPARSGDANLTGFEYRYASGDTVPETDAWETASSSQASNRSIIISGLEDDTLYTFEVRAVNGNDKRGALARVRATTSAMPDTTTPSAPGSLTATPGEPYTKLDSVDDPLSDAELPARVALVDVTLQWEPAADHGNAVIDYVYRYAQGGSVPSSEPWRFATSHSDSDELELTVSQLYADTTYTLEVAARVRNGATGPPDSVQITTPAYPGPHYTLSAPSSADDNETFTITVSRTNRDDGESTAIVEIRGPGQKDVAQLAAEFGADDSSATVTYKVSEDDQTTTDREIRIRIGHVGPSLDNTYSVEWHIVDINNITTQ